LTLLTSSIFTSSVSIFFLCVCVLENHIYFVLFWFIVNPYFSASFFNFWNVFTSAYLVLVTSTTSYA
jgi:hypothetical protein